MYAYKDLLELAGLTARLYALLSNLHHLPALPAAWPRGRVTGLRARGGFVVDLTWESGRLTGGRLRSTRGGVCRLRTAWPLHVDGGGSRPAAGANPNPFHTVHPVAAPLLAPGVTMPAPPAATSQAIDVDTRPGGEVTFTT